LLEQPNAPVRGGVDLRAQPLSEAVRQQAAFLNGLETTRLLGNFEDPGLNVAGTMTYGDAQGAQQGAAALKELHQKLESYGWMMALVGIQQPVKKLEVAVQDREAQFVAGIDGQAIGQLLDKLTDLLAAMPQSALSPVPAPPPSAPLVPPGVP